ncbi:MAG: hypothetical protein EB076_07745 [Flavobacteriia bacterium]|nr:hypothetical protein [Flavobacteriia bacterium]
MNAKITIQELRTRSELKDFVTFAIDLYKGNTYYVPPIIESELDTLDPAVNPIFKDAEARYFVALQGGKIVGRIAALINHIEISQLGKKRMRFGWFDAIDQPEVSQALLDQVIAIGKEKKMDTVEGPMGFSNLDKAGLLIKGFEERSTMITWYNAPYY